MLLDAKPVVLFGTKRECGRRLLKLDRATVQVLASWRVAQIEERLTAVEKWDNSLTAVEKWEHRAGIHPAHEYESSATSVRGYP